MHNKDFLSVAVVSDLHAFEPQPDTIPETEPSFFSTRTPDSSPTENPILQLQTLCRDEKLTADLLICPGDVGDKANPAGIIRGWNAVQQIAQSLQASRWAATTGNHDVDSRGSYNGFDPRGFLQTLNPSFPTNDDACNDRYWSRNFTLITDDHYRILLLNSSAFHGYKDEHKRGRVSRFALEQIEKELLQSQPREINILVCHHHPHKHADTPFDEEYDAIEGGSNLLELLGSDRHGSWIVIHGHKHLPKICYAAGTNSPPTVFSAGSLCAKLTGKLGTLARNQFYLLQFPFSDITAYGLVGQFQAWDWSYGAGWKSADPTSLLPPRGGFGCRRQPAEIATEIKQLFAGADAPPFLDWDDIQNRIPVLKYILPNTLTSLVTRLKEQHYAVDFDGVLPTQIAPPRTG